MVSPSEWNVLVISLHDGSVDSLVIRKFFHVAVNGFLDFTTDGATPLVPALDTLDIARFIELRSNELR